MLSYFKLERHVFRVLIELPHLFV